MNDLPDRVASTLTVDDGYAWRVGWATALAVWLRARAIRMAIVTVVGAAVVVSSGVLGSVIGVALGAFVVLTQALLPVSIAATVAAASRRTSPPGSRLTLRIDHRDIEFASVSSTVRFARSEVDSVRRSLGFVWMRRGRRTAWFGVPEALVHGPTDASVADAAPHPGTAPAVDDALAPFVPAIVDARMTVDAERVRAISRSLVVVLLPIAIAPAVLGIVIAGLVLALTGALEVWVPIVLVVLLVVVLALSVGSLAIRMPRSVARRFPVGSEIRLQVDAQRLRLETPTVSVDRSLASITRIRRRGRIVSLWMRGALWSWVPGDLFDDGQIAELRARIGQGPSGPAA